VFFWRQSPLTGKWDWFLPEIHQSTLVPPSLCRQKKKHWSQAGDFFFIFEEMLGWQQKVLWYSHILLHSFIFWIKKCFTSTHMWYFRPKFSISSILEKNGVCLAFSSNFFCFCSKNLVLPHYFLAQSGYKLPKKIHWSEERSLILEIVWSILLD
jgi:hypothetical protein